MTQPQPPKLSHADIEAIKSSVDIAAIIGSKVALQKQGVEWKGRCPFHNESTASFYVVPKRRMFYCFGCTVTGDVFEWLKRAEGLDFPAAVARLGGAQVASSRQFTSASATAAPRKTDSEDTRKKIEKARKIWGESVPAHGTIVETYLHSRGLRDVMLPPSLRFHSHLWNTECGGTMPGMVASVLDARGKIVGIHRTFLREDGSGKAHVSSAKKMLGACRGAHVWLGLPTNGVLAVAEGIETAMTVMKAKPNIGVWAALSLNNMDAPIPRSVTELILCADGDNKDPKAAEKVLQAAVRKHREVAGRIVRIARPPAGKDFNDMVRV